MTKRNMASSAKNITEDAPLNMILDYKSPEQTYGDALNFGPRVFGDGAQTTTTTAAAAASALRPQTAATSGGERGKRSINDRLRGFVQRLNDSAYVYPTVAVLIMTLIVIVAIFQQATSTIIKVLLILMLMAFLFYTIWQFRSKS